MFQIGHVSDLHVFALTDRRPTRFVNKRMVGGANLLFNRKKSHSPQVVRRALDALVAHRVDHLAVSGDVSNLALDEEFQEVARLLDDTRLGADQISVVPGNHDYYTPEVARTGRFERHFAQYQRSDLPQHQLASGYPFCRLRGDVAIIGLNTGIATPPMWATGKVDERELRALGKLLEDEAVASRFVVVMLHHPLLPFEHTRTDYMRRLINAADVLDVLRRHDVGLAIHGHNHYFHHLELPHLRGTGTLHVCEAGSTSIGAHHNPCFAGKYNIYHIEDRRLVKIDTYKFEGEDAGFVTWREHKVNEVVV